MARAGTRCYEREHPPGFRWLHESFGTNWRMLGDAGGDRADSAAEDAGVDRSEERQRETHPRRALAARGETGPVRLAPFVTSESGAGVHAYYRYYCYVRPENLAPGWDRDRIAAEINASGVPCLHGSCSEIYREKAFEESGLAPAQRLPRAIELGETSLAFLVHPTLNAQRSKRQRRLQRR